MFRSKAQRKYDAELRHWGFEIDHLREWFEGRTDWWGIPAPSRGQERTDHDLWSVNAILTMHRMRPSYHEELQLERDAFTGQRVLEVGCGPLAPILSFDRCERHGLDPLIDRYMQTGWPLYALDVTFVNGYAERMPYPDGWFDSVISVNALDHVDDFQATAREIERVLKPGGRLVFEVEYHEKPTVTEPLALSDSVILSAFTGCDLDKVREISATELFGNLVKRYGLQSKVIPGLGSGERYALWSGVRHDAGVVLRDALMEAGRREA